MFFVKFLNNKTYHSIRCHFVYNGNNESKDGHQQQQTSWHYDKKTSHHNHISAEHGTNEVDLCDVQVEKHASHSCSNQLQLHNACHYMHS